MVKSPQLHVFLVGKSIQIEGQKHDDCRSMSCELGCGMAVLRI